MSSRQSAKRAPRPAEAPLVEPEEREELGGEDAGADQIGIQSVEVGMRLLVVLADLTADAAPPMLKTLAAAADMAPAKAHRYMVSFLRTGVVEREPSTGRLRLGPMARHIGISSIRSMDVVKLAAGRLPQVCAQLGQSVALAIWAYQGPIIIAAEDVRRPVTIGTRVGEVMPLLTSATGRVFGAWMPEATIRPILAAELKASAGGGPVKTAAQAQQLFAETRKAGIGWTAGGLNATVNALSAPIYDFRGSFVAALSALGSSTSFDVALDGKLARGIREAANEISRELGCRI